MIVKVRQVGSTLVVTIPKAIAREIGAEKGQRISLGGQRAGKGWYINLVSSKGKK